MTEPHPDDEQLSAALDGDDRGAVVASHLPACAVCAARSAALSAAAGQVRTATVAPLDDDALDRLVAGALEAFDPAADRTPAVAPVTPMRSIGRRRSSASRRGATRWLGGVASVAALLVLFVGVGSLLRWGARLDTSDDAAISRSEEGVAADSSSAAPVQESAGTGAAPAAGTAYVPVLDLGARDDVASLVAGLRTMPSGAAQSQARGDAGAPALPLPAPGSAATLSCFDAATALGRSAGGSVQSAAVVRWRGVPAQVFVFTLPAPVEGASRQAFVLDAATCAPLTQPRF